MPLRKPRLKEPEIHEDSAETRIRALAAEHGITAERDGVDAYCDQISRLAGDEINFDETQELVVALRKAKVMDGVELTKLHARYLEERK